MMWWYDDVMTWFCDDVMMWFCDDVILWWCGDVMMWWYDYVGRNFGLDDTEKCNWISKMTEIIVFVYLEDVNVTKSNYVTTCTRDVCL